MKKDPRIDAYIQSAAPFSKPILRHLRKLIHRACPEVTETIKWSFASFDYKGPFVSMAAFKHHAVFGFWKSSLLDDPQGYLGMRKSHGGEAMGNLGRITSMDDLPPDRVILDFLRQAMRLNEKGVKLPPRKKAVRDQVIETPVYLATALRKQKLTRTFNAMSYSHRKEYIEWLQEARKAETRERRLAMALDWIAEGKGRNWKYDQGKRSS